MHKDILLIEDDDLIRDLYLKELTSAQMTCDAFATGKEALESLQQNSYTMALLDIMLPDTNGVEILKAIKGNPATQKMLVAMLTNLGQEAVQQEAMKQGARDYIIKMSFSPDQLIERVKVLLKEAQTIATAAV